VNKLIGLHELVELLMKFGLLGLSKLPALYIIVKIKGYTLVALYVPPIVEIRSSYEIIQKGLETLDRIKTGREKDERVLPGINGDVKIYASKIVEEVIERVKRSNAVNRGVDGTHRSRTIYTAGTTIQNVVIEKPEGDLATFTVPIEYLIVTRKKPNKEDRFLGLEELAWLNLDRIGVDA